MAEEILELIPALGRAARMAGAMIEVHSFSVNVRAGRGYISFLEIVVCKAFQSSACDDRPKRSLAAQFGCPVHCCKTKTNHFRIVS